MTEEQVFLLILVVVIAAIVIGGILFWPAWRDAHLEQDRILADMRRRRQVYRVKPRP